MAFGLVTSNVRHEVDPAWPLLSEHLDDSVGDETET